MRSASAAQEHRLAPCDQFITYVRLAGTQMEAAPPSTPGDPSIHEASDAILKPSTTPRRSPRLQGVVPLSPIAQALLSNPAVPLTSSAPCRLETPSKQGKPRLQEDIESSRSHQPPINWPRGPWGSRFEARDELNRFFQPGFAVSLDSFKSGTSRTGSKVYLLCHRHKRPAPGIGVKRVRGCDGANCKWKIALELSTAGWVISKLLNVEHSHELVTCRAEANAHACLRSIPEDMCMFGDFLKSAGMAPAEILKCVDMFLSHRVSLPSGTCISQPVLYNDDPSTLFQFCGSKVCICLSLPACYHSLFNELADRSGREKTWSYNDVYNKYKVSAEDRRQDASRFCDWLKEIDSHGLPTFMDVNSFGQLECAAFTVPKAVEWWAINQENISIHYDTTFGTNRSGMKLGMMTGVDGDGHTRILFVTLVARQNAKSFQWCFKKLREVFKVAPVVIFTDSDPAMGLAISVELPEARHLLCTWHLSLNMATNVKPAAGSMWDTITKKFWDICKQSDILSRDTFDAEFRELVNLVPVPAQDHPEKLAKYNTAVEWFGKLSDKRQRWAARWTWQYFTAGKAV